MTSSAENARPLRVLSVSLGSPARDHAIDVELGGRRVHVERRGTGGDFDAFLRMFREHDGRVDAFGVGGAEFYMEVAGRRYEWRQLRQVRRVVTRSKLADGNGVKHVLEPMAVDVLREAGVSLTGRPALCVAAVDRYGLARSLVDAGCRARFGDLGSIGLPVTLGSLRKIHALAPIILPVLSRMPFSVVYPVGDDDKPVKGVLRRQCARAEVIAGDFLQVKANLPDDLRGKIVITNTTTAADVADLQARGLAWLVTTTPRLGGRSFGTNVMEAICRALTDKPDAAITPGDLRERMTEIALRPQLHRLNA